MSASQREETSIDVKLPFWRQLRWRLAIVFIILAVTPMTIVMTIVVINNQTQAQEQTLNQLESVAQLKQNQIEQWLEDSESNLQQYVAIIGEQRLSELAESSADDVAEQAILRVITEQLADTSSLFDELFFYGTDGAVLLSSNPVQVGKIVVNQPYFSSSIRVSLDAEESEHTFIQSPYYDINTGALTTILTHPIIDEQTGELTAVMAGRLDLSRIDGIMLELSGLGETGETYLVSPESNYFLTPSRFEDDGYIQARAYHSVGIDNAIEGINGLGQYDDYRDPAVPVFGAYRWLPGLDVALLAEVDVAEALASTIALRNFSIVLIAVAGLIAGGLGLFVAQRIANPVSELTETAVEISNGNLEQQALIKSRDEIGVLASAFNSMTAQLRHSISFLEERVASRTRSLEISTEVSRQLSTILDVDELLFEVVNQIRDSFNYYHAQVYIYDPQKMDLIMRRGTGEAGQQMLESGHKLRNNEGLVGRAAANNQVVLITDVMQDDSWLANKLLPDTKSEAAIPIAIGDEVYGVLDVQHNEIGGLNEESVALLQSIANQVAIALQNARVFAQINQQATIIENTDAFIATTTLDGVVLFVNPTGLGMLGYENLDDVLSRSFTELQPQMVQQFEDEILPAVLKDGVWHGETAVYHRDGQRIPVDQTTSLIRDENGQPSALATNAIDITERKLAEVQLAERVKQLNLLNDIGRKANEGLPLSEFLHWASERMPQAMRYPEACIAAITLDDKVYGEADAIELKRHFVEEIWVRGEQSGRIYVAYTNEVYTFGDEESAMMGGVSRRISSYIEAQYLLEQLQTQAADLQKVVQIGTAVSTIYDPNLLLQELTDSIFAQFNLYQVNIFLLEKAALMITASSGKAGQALLDQALNVQLQTQKSLVARVARTRRGMIVNDVAAEPDFMAHVSLPSVGSELIVPLVIGDQVLGVLDVESEEVDRFSEEDLNIFTTLAAQIAVTLQNARQHEQTQEALRELNALQRVITGEGWHTFMQAQEKTTKGYIASKQRVLPIEELGSTNGKRGTDVVVPLAIRGTNIGRLGVKNAANLAEEDHELLEAVSRQVAEALERARLFEESEISRQQTNALYAGSEQVIRADSMSEVLKALVESTAISRLEQASLLFFDHAWDDTPPEMLETVAVWEKSADAPSVPVGTKFPTAVYPIFDVLDRNTPLVIEDTETFVLSETTKALFKQFGTRSAIAFALVAGDAWIGILTAQSQSVTAFTSEEVKQIASLVSQAAVVVQTQRLFGEAETRAQQEQILRQVSERVYGAVDAESVLKTAVQEVGRALGLEAFVYLHDEAETEDNLQTETAVNGTAN